MKSYRPLRDWKRHHPTARRIADRLLADPAILNLRTRRLEQSIRDVYGVGRSTALIAVTLARTEAPRLRA